MVPLIEHFSLRTRLNPQTLYTHILNCNHPLKHYDAASHLNILHISCKWDEFFKTVLPIAWLVMGVKSSLILSD
jgi:hypothetical protein